MKKTKAGGGGCGTAIIALCVLMIGCGLLIFFPVGTLLGIALIVFALKMGARKKVWKCSSCGYFFERD